ncbi:lipopolysaccharide heptosyltransferase II [PVC group bacterium (ex Bugula neritina AB1)]|nr:lipopolysaccharide heptosyltransferase II [PVC group bacterium (ex Bugula neritina AB1)]
MENIKRILIMMPNWLGDAVMALPLVQLLRETYPSAFLAILTPDHLEKFYTFQPHIDKVIPWKKTKSIKGTFQIVHKLNSLNFDLAVLCPNSFFSALIIAMSRIKRRIGYDKSFRKFLLTDHLPFPKKKKKKHQTRLFIALGLALWDKPEAPKFSNSVTIPEFNKQSIKLSLKRNHNIEAKSGLIGLAIGSAYGPAKNWSVERYRQLGLALYKKYNTRILLLGTQKDHDSAHFMVQHLENVFINLCGQTGLDEVQSLLSLCRVFIGNDSGLAHVAALLNTPSIVIFGSTSPFFSQPLGNSVKIVYSGVDCSPCFKRTCPLGTMECMKSIKVKHIMEKVDTLMKGSIKKNVKLKRHPYNLQ